MGHACMRYVAMILHDIKHCVRQIIRFFAEGWYLHASKAYIFVAFDRFSNGLNNDVSLAYSSSFKFVVSDADWTCFTNMGCSHGKILGYDPLL